MNNSDSVVAVAANDDTKTTDVRAPKTASRKKPRAAPRPPNTATGRGERSTARGIGARPGSKTAKILALLQRPGGATVKELRRVTGWQAHSVRGFLSGVIMKKLKLRVTSTKRDDGQRSYRVRSK